MSLSAAVLFGLPAKASDATSNAAHKVAHASVPVRFEPNRGQAAPAVRYVGRAAGYEVALEPRQVTISVPQRDAKNGASHDRPVTMSLVGSKDSPAISATGELPGKSNYFPTSDSRTWLTNLPNYSTVLYRGVYPRTDLVFRGDGSRLEYDFRIAPGGDPARIAWKLAPSDKVNLDNGDLLIRSAGVQLRFLKPAAYQDQGGTREPVESSYRLRHDASGSTVEFAVGKYDHRRPLIIDPVLVYSTQLGAVSDIGSMTLDSSGNVYVASASNYSLEVAKLAPDGQTLLYSATIGSVYTSTSGIAVDATGQVYLAGSAYPGYVTTAGAYQPVAGSGTHAFLTVLNSTGTGLVYSTYLEGSTTDYGESVAVDPSGKVLVAGYTYSSDFPNTGASVFSGYYAAFVAKFDITQSGAASLVYSSLLPSASYDASAVSVKSDSAGKTYVAINADYLNPTAGAYNYHATNSGNGGVYVVQLDSAGATQVISYLGYGTAYDMAVDGAGNAYVVGTVYSGDYPATPGAYQTSYPNSFLTKLNAGGASLAYSTYLGGPSGQEIPTSVALPPGCTTNCTPLVGGSTYADDFPAVNAIQSTRAGSYDAVVVSLTADGSAATFSSYFGGTGDDSYYRSTDFRVPAVALDAAGNMYVAGNTYSTDFPFTTYYPSAQPFIAEISPSAGSKVIPDRNSISFGGQTMTVPSAPQVINFRNYGSTAASITTPVSSNNPAFTTTDNCGGSIPAGGSCAVQVTFTPTVAGYVNGTISLGYNGNFGASVAVNGTGYDQAQLSLSPGGNFGFGAVTAGTSSAAQTYTLTSVGSQRADIYSITVSDSTNFKVVSTNCPGFLAPGASCTFSLAFTPSSTGSFASYYYVSSNASVLPSYEGYLTGTGTGIGVSSITPSTTALSFPDQVVGTSSNPQYTYLYNTGTIPVSFGTPTVTGDFTVSTGCGGYAANPGDYCSVSVTFNPTTTGTRTGTLTVPNSAGANQVISLTGTGTAATSGLVFSPTTLGFSDQVVGTTSSSATVQVTNTGNAPVTISRVFDNGGDFRITYNGCITTLQPFSSCQVLAAFTPSMVGAESGTLTFIDTEAGSPQVITLTGNGVAVTSSVIPSQTSAAFDDTVIGSSGPIETFYLYNPGNAPVSISSVVSSAPSEFVVAYNGCNSIPASSLCQINVQFQPQAAGARAGTLTITHSVAGSPVVISMTGNGISPANSLVPTPLNLNFSDTVVGTTSSPQLVYFYNPGNTTVTVSQVEVSGDFTIYSNGCGNPGPNGYCYVYVQFTPTASGTRTGTLTLFDSTTASPHTVPLSGNAVNVVSTMVATPSSLGFDDQVVGTSSGYQYVTLYNPGNVPITISDISVSGDFTASGCSTISPNSYCSLYVTFAPTAAGARTGTITLTDTASGSPHGISLYGNGLAATSTIAVVPSAVDFGSVAVNVSAPSQAVYIHNTGTQSVSISSVTATSPFVASGCITTISPASSCALNVSVNSSTTGTVTGTLTITDSATGSPHSVSLTANITASTPAISVAANGITFPRQVTGQTTSQSGVTFQNNSGSTVTVSSVTTTGDFAVSTNNCASVANGSSCSVYATFTPTASGVRTGTLVFTHDGPGGSTSINLNGYGDTSTSVVQTSASALSFNDQVVNTASNSQTVYLWNNGTTNVTMGSSTITGPFAITYNACSGTVAPGSYCYVNVNFQPTVAGSASGALTINDNDPASPHVVTLSGTGVDPTKTMEPSTTAIQFNDQTVGYTSAAQTVYFYNTGNSQVTLTATPAVTGDFAIQYNACGSSVGAGSYCYVNLTFTPTAAGTRTGTLTLTDDAVGSPQTVALSGNGIAATKKYSVTTTAVAFPDQPVGTQSYYSQPVIFYNTGTAPIVLSGTTLTGADFILNYNGCYAYTLQPGDYCYVYLLFKPTATGARTGSISIGNDAPAGPAVVTLSGPGVAAVKTAQLSATSLNFADQAVGTTSVYYQQYVYLYNTGNVPLTVGQLTATGDYSIPYDYCSNYTVSVHGYCYFYITFTPTASGTRTGSISVPDDSTTSPHTIALTGNGLTPSLRINITPGNLAFPPTPTGSTSYTYEIAVLNTGNTAVQMNSTSITGADFKETYSTCESRSLAVRSSCYVDVVAQPTVIGPLTGTLTFSDTATGSPQTVGLSGTGTDPNSAFQLSQNAITFPNQPTGTTSPATIVYLVNRGSTPVTVSSVTPSGDFSFSGCSTSTVYQSSYCAMYVYFTPTATGTRTGSISIVDSATGSPHTISLSGTGVVPFPTASLVPSSLNFGNQAVLVASTTQSFTIYNTGSAAMNVTSIASTSSDFGVSTGCVGSIPAGSYCSANVTFTPQAAGTRTGAIQVTDDASGSPQQVVLSGTGVSASPLFSPSPNSYVFAGQLVSTTSPAQGFTITNSGTSNLVISALTISGPFNISSSTCTPTVSAITVTPGSNCSLSVTFTPTSVGAFTGLLTFTDNATGSPHQIALSGTGLSGPSLTVSPSSLLFNPQQVNTSSSIQYITVSNSGATATVSSVSISAGPFTQTNNCGAISGGSYCSIGVTFSPTATGTQTATLSIVDDAPGSPHTVSLNGSAVGQPAVTLSSTSLTFPNQNVGTTSASQSVTMTNTGAGPLSIATIFASGDFAVTHNCGNNLIVNGSCTLTVTFTPDGANSRTGTVTITDNAGNSPQTVSLTGTGIGAVANPSPTSLTFASQAVGTTSAAQTITLTNSGNADLNITSISSDSSQFTQTNNCTAMLSAASSCTISVTYAPTIAGSVGGSIIISTSNGGTPVVSLSGSGTGPVSTVSPTSLNFGSVTLNTASGTQTVTVSSTGTTALTIGTISVSGDYAQTNNCPTSLATGSNCTVTVTFTPTSAATRTGTLTIPDNGVGGGHTVSLTGIGLGPLVSLNPTSLNFGSNTLGVPATPQTITVTNSGTVNITGLTVSLPAGDFTQGNNCPASLSVSATCTITVSFTATQAGTRSATLSVSSNAPTQSASLLGVGSGPLVQLNPTSLSFGNQVINTSSSAQTVTLTNGGNSNLNIASIAGSGDYTATNNCPAALSPSSSCTISVTFTPTVIGPDPGNVGINDDAAGSPQLIGTSGTGIQPAADLSVSGAASPATIPPGGSTTYLFTVANAGPSTATSVTFSATPPTNAQVTAAYSANGSCTVGTTISCPLSDLPANTSTTVTIGAAATAIGPLSTTATVSATQSDSNTVNNSATVSAVVGEADLVVTASRGSSGTAYVVTVTNNGPTGASGVSLSCAYDRYSYSSSSATQGSCGLNGSSLSCSLGNIASGASVNVTQLVQPPSTGWATIACNATAGEYDPNPVNNSAQISPDGATNTIEGDNVSVQLYDRISGTAARVVFPSVRKSGITDITGVAGANPPAGFRNGAQAWTYDVTTTASTVGSPMVAFAVPASQFHHPAKVRLFHMESGAWVDRTISQNGSAVAGISTSLSPFALFEPINHAPVAEAGADRVMPGSSVLGASVTLDGGASADVDGDALSYRWSGPFPEGNGVVTGAHPSVTLPFGTSRVSLVVNDGEADSAVASVAVTVSDFGVTPASTSVDVVRGSTATIPVQIAAVGGAYNQAVTLSCANLPAGMTCSFSPASVQPGATGATSNLTISTTTTVAATRRPGIWGLTAMMFGIVGMFGWPDKRRRRMLFVALLLIALIVMVQVGCGGGASVSTSTNQPTVKPATTTTIAVTATSGGLSHSSNVTVTLH